MPDRRTERRPPHLSLIPATWSCPALRRPPRPANQTATTCLTPSPPPATNPSSEAPTPRIDQPPRNEQTPAPSGPSLSGPRPASERRPPPAVRMQGVHSAGPRRPLRRVRAPDARPTRSRQRVAGAQWPAPGGPRAPPTYGDVPAEGIPCVLTAPAEENERPPESRSPLVSPRLTPHNSRARRTPHGARRTAHAHAAAAAPYFSNICAAGTIRTLSADTGNVSFSISLSSSRIAAGVPAVS